MTSSANPDEQGPIIAAPKPYKRSFYSRVMPVVRQTHLYAGLFMLPWVFLYGITGAMYNHQQLLPEVTTTYLGPEVLADSKMSQFPNPDQFAENVVEALRQTAGDTTISLAENHGAQFTNDMMFEVHDAGFRYVVHIDPISQQSKVVTHPPRDDAPKNLLTDVRNVDVKPDPHEAARQSAAKVLQAAGVNSQNSLRPLGWTKLNFLANVDGEPARVTYVLKDGHVDVTRFTGSHGMTTRQFFLRLHTSHGQPPHWNGRMVWSLAVDAMAIAMVCWGLTGVLMWWQLKRTRAIGAVVLVASVLTATLTYFGMHQFYAHTML